MEKTTEILILRALKMLLHRQRFPENCQNPQDDEFLLRLLDLLHRQIGECVDDPGQKRKEN